MQISDFLHICKPQIYSQLSNHSHQFSISIATKITCTLPFSQPLAAASPSTNRPKSKSGYLAIVSLKHGRLVRIRSQYSLFRRSPTRQNLPPATFDASERLLYSSPFAPVQSLKAVLVTNHFNFYKNMPVQSFEPRSGSPEGRGPRSAFWFFLQKQKERKNVPVGNFSGKERQSQSAPFVSFRKKKNEEPPLSGRQTHAPHENR